MTVDPKEVEILVDKLKKACEKAGDGSEVFLPGTKQYEMSQAYYVASSSYPSQAAVEPSSTKGLIEILAVIEELQVPFSVKGGGHSMAPFFPPRLISAPGPSLPETYTSTRSSEQELIRPNVLIAMSRFNKVVYNTKDATVEAGAGCLWQDLYDVVWKLQPARNVVGGSGIVGVAGYLLGGGYSYLMTNQFGLGIDNIAGFEVVLPSGKVVNARPNDDTADLYNCLRGGGANFGIVTKFILHTYERPPTMTQEFEFDESQKEKVKEAFIDWIKNEVRPQSGLVSFFRYYIDKGELKFQLGVDVTSDTEEAFERFRKIKDPKPYTLTSFAEVDALYASVYAPKPARDAVWKAIVNQTSDHQSHYYYSPELSQALENLTHDKTRGRFGCVMVHTYTKKLINEIDEQAKIASAFLTDHGGISGRIEVWPFLPSIFDKSPPGAAWPHTKGKSFGPCVASFRWKGEENDRFWLTKIDDALKAIYEVAKSEGVTSDGAPVYLNASLENTTVEAIYQDNLEPLRLLRKKYDPTGLMSLTGGFKIPLPLS